MTKIDEVPSMLQFITVCCVASQKWDKKILNLDETFFIGFSLRQKFPELIADRSGDYYINLQEGEDVSPEVKKMELWFESIPNDPAPLDNDHHNQPEQDLYTGESNDVSLNKTFACPWKYVLAWNPNRIPNAHVESTCVDHICWSSRPAQNGATSPMNKCSKVNSARWVKVKHYRKDGSVHWKRRILLYSVGCTCTADVPIAVNTSSLNVEIADHSSSD